MLFFMPTTKTKGVTYLIHPVLQGSWPSELLL